MRVAHRPRAADGKGRILRGVVPAAAAACRAAAAAAAPAGRAGDQRGRPAQARDQVPAQRHAPHARVALRHTGIWL